MDEETHTEEHGPGCGCIFCAGSDRICLTCGAIVGGGCPESTPEEVRAHRGDRLRLVDLDYHGDELPDTAHETTVREMLADNEDDEDVREKVRALQPGQTIVLGGGAGVAVRVTNLEGKLVV